jgi:Tfp pilus assembly protein PilF
MSDRKKQLLELLQSDPNDVFLHYALGMEALSENDLQAALTQFQKTIGLQENYHAAYYQLALIYRNIDITDVAFTFASKGLKHAQDEKNIKAVQEFQSLINELQEINF